MPTRGNARKIGIRVDIRPGAVGAPERRVRRQRQQHRHVDAHPVGDVDRLLGVVDADVDVHPEDELLPRDEAQRVDEVVVARAAHDALVLPHRERVRARPSRSPAPCACAVGADPPAQRAQLVAGLARVRARVRGDLEHRLHELGLDLAVGAVLEELLDRVGELERLSVDDHELLLDAQRVALRGEVLVHARAGAYPGITSRAWPPPPT